MAFSVLTVWGFYEVFKVLWKRALKSWLTDELLGCSILRDVTITNRYSALSPMTAYTVNVNQVLLTKSFYSERIGFLRSHENCKNMRPFSPDLLHIAWTKYIVETLNAVFSYEPETVPDKSGADTVQTVALCFSPTGNTARFEGKRRTHP